MKQDNTPVAPASGACAAPLADEPQQAGDKEPLDLALADLFESADLFVRQVLTLQRLRDDGFFKHISKGRRNELLHGIVEAADKNRDLARAVQQSMKKIKRERIAEEVLDKILEAASDDRF